MLVKIFEFAFAVGELLCPAPDEPSIQPPFGRSEGFKAFNGFQPAVDVGIVEFYQIGSIGAVWDF